MSNDQTQNQDEGAQIEGGVQAPSEPTEEQLRQMLRLKAKNLGIEFSPNIGNDTLREKIRIHQEALERGEQPGSKKNQVNPLGDDVSPAKNPQERRRQLLAENMRLIRLRIQNLDPKKKDLPGEILTVANSRIGTVRKFVPYGEVTEGGYHVPYILYKMMKRRKFLHIVTKKGKGGTPTVSTKYVPEFSLEILDPLTPAELKNLAQAQIAAGSIEHDS